MFLRKTKLAREPLAVTMSGVRLGERALQIGDADPGVIAQIAAKCGLTGTAAIVVRTDDGATRMQRAIADTGAVADVHVVPTGDLPFQEAAFDAIVVHDTANTIDAAKPDIRARWLAECRRVLRPGGRIIVLEPGTAVGLRGLLAGGAKENDPTSGSAMALRAGGFVSVRSVGDREGVRFIEGLKAI
jgi:SAM-dependent methyltransferase